MTRHVFFGPVGNMDGIRPTTIARHGHRFIGTNAVCINQRDLLQGFLKENGNN